MICSTTAEGLRYAVLKEGKRAAYCALSINCGTRVENVLKTSSRGGHYPSGTAHFVEHALFKGTARHSAQEINGYLERLGGELNAYTTKEEIVLHSTVLSEDLRKAADLLFELATEPLFPDGEVQKEKTVILEEIASYKDSPADDIYDRFESMLFEGHPLCGTILGTAASVKGLEAENLREYVREFFVPSRMAMALVSPLEEAQMALMVEELSREYFRSGVQTLKPGMTDAEAGKANPGAEPVFASLPATSALPNLFDKTINRHTHQANCILGSTAPSLYREQERIAASLMANILGGPASNSILNSLLREKNGWVYNVECNYTQYADTGMMAVSFGCDRERLDDCISAIYGELERLRDCPMDEDALAAAKKQLKGQLAIASDNGESQALSMGKSLLVFGRVYDDETICRQIDAVTPQDIQASARAIFAPDRLSKLVYL